MIKSVGVIGAGQMGSGIAQVSAMRGFSTILTDEDSSQLLKAKKNILISSDKLREKNKISDKERNNVEDFLIVERETDQLNDCHLIIEAIKEDEQIKSQLFKSLKERVKPSCIIATNTSSISINRLAKFAHVPGNFIGLHFMNPVPIMDFVEVIPGLATTEQTQIKALKYIENLGKQISISSDFPGFIVNRILMPMINEAFRCLMENVASRENIDKAMKLGTHQPMGPLALADLIGLDTCRAILKVMYEGFGDPKYAPCPLLNQFVEAGYLGRKTKKGVYTY